MSRPSIVDSHCHLDFPEYAEDIREVLSRAKEAGVVCMQTIGTRLSSFPKVLAVAEQFPEVYCSVGVHPHNVEEEGIPSVETIVNFTKHPKVIGIGETGLDFYYEHSPRLPQTESFKHHLLAASQTKIPVIVHSRGADQETVDSLTDVMSTHPFAGLIHCFSTTRMLAFAAIEMGLKISLSGIITFKKSEDLRAIVKELPLSSLLLETDAPFLAPVPHRGGRNEPSYTALTGACLAEIHGVSYEEVARVTTESFYQLFTKVPKAH